MTEERAKEIAEALHKADEKELSEWIYISQTAQEGSSDSCLSLPNCC